MEEVVNNGEIVATYPSVFVGTAIGGTIFEFICMIVCIVAAPLEQKILLTTLLLVITSILIIISIGFKRYKVIVNSEGITEIPLLGKKKSFILMKLEVFKSKDQKQS